MNEIQKSGATNSFPSHAELNSDSKGVWKKLDPDAFCEILSYLREDEMDAISRTDRKWRDLTLNVAKQKIACNSFLRAQTKITDIEQLQTTLFSQFGQDLSIPEILIKCPNLKTLDLTDLEIDDAQFAVIAKACSSSLEHLYLNSNTKLRNPDFSSLRNLRTLNLAGCTKLRRPKFNSLINLQELILAECFKLKDPDFTSLVNLEHLGLSECFGLKKPNFSSLVNLRSLYLDNCSKLQNPTFGSLKNLETMFLRGCPDLIIDHVLSIEGLSPDCKIHQ